MQTAFWPHCCGGTNIYAVGITNGTSGTPTTTTIRIVAWNASWTELFRYNGAEMVTANPDLAGLGISGFTSLHYYDGQLLTWSNDTVVVLDGTGTLVWYWQQPHAPTSSVIDACNLEDGSVAVVLPIGGGASDTVFLLDDTGSEIWSIAKNWASSAAPVSVCETKDGDVAVLASSSSAVYLSRFARADGSEIETYQLNTSGGNAITGSQQGLRSDGLGYQWACHRGPGEAAARGATRRPDSGGTNSYNVAIPGTSPLRFQAGIDVNADDGSITRHISGTLYRYDPVNWSDPGVGVAPVADEIWSVAQAGYIGGHCAPLDADYFLSNEEYDSTYRIMRRLWSDGSIDDTILDSEGTDDTDVFYYFEVSPGVPIIKRKRGAL